MDLQSAPGQTYEGLVVNDILDRRTGNVAIPGNPDGLVAFAEVGAGIIFRKSALQSFSMV